MCRVTPLGSTTRPTMSLPDLFRTKLHLIGLSGQVVDHPAAFELRTPRVPNFFHGNLLLWKEVPTDLAAMRALFASCFGEGSKHELFMWGPEPASVEFMAEAARAGFEPEQSVALALDSPPDEVDHGWTIRPLRLDELDASFALADAADGASGEGGDPDYQEFKRRICEHTGDWVRAGQVTWWGVFVDDALVGQCGMAHCNTEIGANLGRFQAVEVHPDFRRRGVATALISTVARDAMLRLRCPRVLLEADPTGPAIALYERIGFRRQTDVHSLLRSRGALQTRVEQSADYAGVRSLVEAAFGQRDEARLVASLRGETGVTSLVAERNGRLLGHVMFSPVTVDAPSPWNAVALAPLAVVPDMQKQGVGSALVQAGLEACREAGAAVCFVLGSPSYYGRFGFRAAEPLGFTCQWPAPSGAFQVLELSDAPDGGKGELVGHAGRVVYATAFDEL